MFKKIAFAAAIAVMASSSFAADGTKFYAGVDVGSSKLDDFDDRETGYGAFIGYKFAPNFAVEGGYRRLADIDYDGGKLTVDQAAISVVGSLPLSNGFGVYGRLGYNRLKADASDFGTGTSNGALYGVGATYAFTPAIVARIELQRPNSDSTNFSAGVAFQF